MCFMPWHKLPSMAISQKNLCCLLFVTLVNYFKSHECKSWILFICVSLWNGESLETKKGSHVFFLALSIFYGFIMKHLLMVFQSSNMYCIKPIFSSPEHKVLMVSYCDRALSVVRRRPLCVVRRPSCVNFFT